MLGALRFFVGCGGRLGAIAATSECQQKAQGAQHAHPLNGAVAPSGIFLAYQSFEKAVN
jgi:hypothetical protein